MRRLTAILATVTVALSGCGRSAEDEVASTVHGYLDAFVSGDGAKACSLMASATRRAFVARIRSTTGTSDCGIALDRIHNQAGPRVLAALRKVKVTDVKIQGDHATAVLATAARSTFTDLQKEHGHWRIAAAPGAQ